MKSVSFKRFWIVTLLTVFFILIAGRSASGITSLPERPAIPPAPAVSQSEARARLSGGFHQILDFFAKREFSLLTASREMRASGDPMFFERRYPEISRELDKWSTTLSKVDVSEASVGRIDFTFILDELAPMALSPSSPDVRRDNALLTIGMVCLMDNLRCESGAFHRFLAAVVADDPSPARKAEALRRWRESAGFIDEGLLASVLASGAGADLELRAEAARALFAIDTRRSLQAQRLLATTAGVAEDPSGAPSRIACTAIGNFADAEFPEAAPELIEALQDPSREVRACAAASLTRLSGRDYGFDAAADGPLNFEAIARWRSWWQKAASAPERSAR